MLFVRTWWGIARLELLDQVRLNAGPTPGPVWITLAVRCNPGTRCEHTAVHCEHGQRVNITVVKPGALIAWDPHCHTKRAILAHTEGTDFGGKAAVQRKVITRITR